MAFYALTQELGKEAPDPTKTSLVEVVGLDPTGKKIFKDRIIIHASVGEIKNYSGQKFATVLASTTVLRFDFENTTRYLESRLQSDGTIALQSGYEKS